MKTIGQQIKWDFKTNGDLQIRDKNDRLIYLEHSNGVWGKCEYDSQGNRIYYENSDGVWAKYEYDSQGECIYYETSSGQIVDKRPKSCEGKMVEFDGVKYKLVKV